MKVSDIPDDDLVFLRSDGTPSAILFSILLENLTS